jgi:3D (Asp-Asp-Asp) domain-containing protein
MLVKLLTVAVAFLHPFPAKHHHRHHRPEGRHYDVSSTCYAEGGQTASGKDAYFGEVAVLPGFLPLHTRIRLDHPAFGKRDFVVLDHIGHGSELDIFNPSESSCNTYGREQRGFRVIA